MAKVTTYGEGVKKTTTVELTFNGYYQEKQIENIKTVDGVFPANVNFRVTA